MRREQVVYALEALAGTQSVELELDPRFTGSLNIEELVQGIRDYDRLADSYRELLPAANHQPTRLAAAPENLIGPMLDRLTLWCDRLTPLLAEADSLNRQRDSLLVLEEAAIAMGEDASQLPSIGHTTDLLFKKLYRCAPRHLDDAVFDGHLEQSFHGKEHCFVVIACLPGQCDHVVEALLRTGCEEVEVPYDLEQQPGRQLADIRHRLGRVSADLAQAENQITLLRTDPQIEEDLANIETLRWFTGAARQVGIKDATLCHITGWTSETDTGRLESALERAHVEAEIRFARPPAGTREPVATASGWWRQPFQVFTALSGAPSPDEIDPTGMLVIVVPLLFGYMFPDIGHGLLIAIAGLVLSRYTLRALILVSCGLAGMLMGVVFDDFFGYRILQQPWQIHALDNPLLVLAIPMLFGVGLLLLGLIFNGIELYWRGEFKRWLLNDAAVLLLYISLLSSLLHDWFLLGAGFALLWYVAGSMALGGRRWAQLALVSITRLAHSALTLVLNTISFVRVGAFALAHIGLTQVVITLSEAVETPLLSISILVIGHGMIIVLEGLVVFVQITRLILFEFFLQFLRSDGRFFQPLTRV